MARRPGFDDGLERALMELAPRLALPAETDLVPRVTAAIRAGAGAPPLRAPRWSRRALAFGMAALVLLASGTLALSPAARDAVADFIGIGGLRVEVGPRPAPLPTTPPGENLSLGVETTLDDARERVDFSIRVPDILGLANPDRVYYSDFPAGGRVSLVYRAQPDWLPEASATGVGLLVTEFRGDVEPELMKKLSSQGQVRPTEVNGSPALWIRGPHTLFFVDEDGRQQTDTLRLSANALIWMEGDVTLRIESELDLVDALTIAESMR
jgi:hypothetical protein